LQCPHQFAVGLEAGQFVGQVVLNLVAEDSAGTEVVRRS